MSRKKKRKNEGVLTAALALGSAVCMALIVLVAVLTMRGITALPGQPRTYVVSAPTQAPTPTPVPTVTPEPTATAAPTATPYVPFEYLPVIKKVDTDEMKIAITVDDCFQAENLKTISRLAWQQGGRLTIFPIGENVVRTGMDAILRVCVNDLGFEVENHTWSHARVFRLPEEQMAAEIWQQSNAVSRALGVNYRQHFFRFMGGDGEYDQRTHNYLKQLGYTAIAHWTLSGSDASLDECKQWLSPGTIYLFHTTDRDTELLREFIPYVSEQGYQLVTLNELMGYPDNEISDLSTALGAMPQPQPYTKEYTILKKGDYSWAVVELQQRLYELGYLSGDAKTAVSGSVADGVYGDAAADAVRRFQADHNLPATGVADVPTQEALFG